MNPQKDPASAQQDANSQNVTSVGAPGSAGLPPLGQEAASTEMPSSPVAGQMIEPQTPAAGADVVPGDSAAAVPANTPASSTAQDSPAGPMFGAGVQAGASPFTPAKRRKKGLFAGLITAAVVLLFSGGAAAAYFGYYVPSQPENVLKRALVNTLDTAKTKTVQFSGSLTLDMKDSGVDKLSGTFSGTSSMESGAYDMTSEIDALVTKITVDSRSTDGKTLYFKVGGLDGLSSLLGSTGDLSGDSAAGALYGSYFDLLNNQWFEVNQSMIDQVTGGSVPGQGLTNAGRQKLAEAYSQHQFLVVKEKMPDQAIKGAKSYHYKIGVDKTQLKAFFAALKNSGVEELKLTDDQLATLNKDIDGAKFDAFGLELWISKADKMIRQVAVSFGQAGDKMSATLTVDSYNKAVNVEKPANAKSLLELMSGLLGGAQPSGLLTPGLEQQALQHGISL